MGINLSWENPFWVWRKTFLRSKFDQNLVKLGQILIKILEIKKIQINAPKCMKNHASDYFWWLVRLRQNLPSWDFAKLSAIIKKSDWHDFSCILVHLFELFWFSKFWSKFDQVWLNFDQILTSKMFSFKPKMGFPKMDWFPKSELFISLRSKVIPPSALRIQRPISLWPCGL